MKRHCSFSCIQPQRLPQLPRTQIQKHHLQCESGESQCKNREESADLRFGMRAEHVTDSAAAHQKPHGTENRFERVDVNQHRDNHRPANEDRDAIFKVVTPAPQPMAAPKDSQHNDARHKRGHIFESSEGAISSEIRCVAITSMVIANANAASMKVSSRVIAMPRKRIRLAAEAHPSPVANRT